MKKKDSIEGHVLLMKHVKLSEDASQNLLKKYNIDRKQLPVIFNKDSALTELDAKPGDIIEITRNSSISNTTKYYRVVVNA